MDKNRAAMRTAPDHERGDFVKSIQRAINVVRKLEAKSRKTDAQLAATPEQWETFQKKGIEARLPPVYLQKTTKLLCKDDAAKEETLSELHMMLTQPQHAEPCGAMRSQSPAASNFRSSRVYIGGGEELFEVLSDRTCLKEAETEVLSKIPRNPMLEEAASMPKQKGEERGHTKPAVQKKACW